MMNQVESDDCYSFVYEDDSSDADSIELYESQTTAVQSTGDIRCHKLSSLQSCESEFEVDDCQFDEGDEFEYDLLRDTRANVQDKSLIDVNLSNLRYESLTTGDIFERMIQRVNHLQPILSIPAEDILLLMQQYDWNEERLLEDWTERADDLLIKAGLKTSDKATVSSDSNVRGNRRRDNFTCMVCCDDKRETFAMECGHEYCIDCYRHYIQDHLNQGNIITCMGCSLALRNEDIDLIMGTASSLKLMDSSIRSFVGKHNRNYKWCPYADCKCIVHLLDASNLEEYTRLHCSKFVTCKSNHSFCFGCGFEMHAPADCNVANAWVKKAKKESENLNWVLAHTKECPKCSVNIEKNGGCNHMVCSSCKYEFCWICEGEWAPHGNSYYQCTMYKNDDDKNKSGKEDYKKTLKRYTFYYRVFNEHEVSAKLDWKLGQNVGHRVRALQETIGVSWIEGQFLPESLKTLNEGRTALKWSFAVAFYSDPSHNLTKIFADNQLLLSNAVEDLSQLLQIKDPGSIMSRKTEFYNKAGYVKNRSKALLECGRDLLRKGICKPKE